jgi:hypothetical protein
MQGRRRHSLQQAYIDAATTETCTASKMATNDDSNKAPLLATLPEELCLAIIEKLDMSSIIALSKTNRQFNRLSDPTAKSRRPMLYEFLLEAQTFPRWQDGFACFTCAKVLPRSRFANAQSKHKRGRNGSDQKRRFCVQCGLENGSHGPGNMVVQGDIIRMVCRQCKRLKSGRFCERCAICTDCDRYGFTLERCAKADWGHAIVGDTLPKVESALSASLGTPLDLQLRGSAYEDVTEQMWSPEWYDGPDDM